jgi:uncharacterized protein (TIGR03067 family)
MMERYGFYEGKGTSYRLEPRRILEVFDFLDAKSELQKLQGLWQTAPGGMVHRDGKQVVYQPRIDGPCFFVRGDRLIWLDKDGKPTGEELTIKLEVTADPKRITFMPMGEEKKKPTHGIYAVEGASLRLHVALDGGPAPKQFLELNKPVEGVDGREWLVGRKKLQVTRQVSTWPKRGGRLTIANRTLMGDGRTAARSRSASYQRLSAFPCTIVFSLVDVTIEWLRSS